MGIGMVLGDMIAAHKWEHEKDKKKQALVDKHSVHPDAEFDPIGAGIDNEIGYIRILDQQIVKVVQEIKERLRNRIYDRYRSSILKEGIDQNLVQTAFEK